MKIQNDFILLDGYRGSWKYNIWISIILQENFTWFKNSDFNETLCVFSVYLINYIRGIVFVDEKSLWRDEINPHVSIIFYVLNTISLENLFYSTVNNFCNLHLNFL